MGFKNLSDESLIQTLKLKVDAERKALMEVLNLICEVEDRKLHLARGFPDLYTFAIQELGYSSGAAYRRISAMRLLKAVPEIAPKLESGALGLENAAQAQSFFRKENQRRKDQGVERLSTGEKRELLSELTHRSTRDGARILAERSPDAHVPAEKVKAISGDRTLVQFTASGELMSKLEELKDLLAHQNFEGRMDVLIEKLADMALKKLKPSSSARPNPSSPAPGIEKKRGTQLRSRYITVDEKRKVLTLYPQKSCSYKDPETGRVCGSKHGVQLDHIEPYSWGGSSRAENLRPLCGAHNRYLAAQMQLI